MKNKWNIPFNLYNALILHKYPVYLIQFVTQRCNAKCPHCFVDFKAEEDELTLEQIEKIAKTSGKCLRNVALTGGEPFIRNDIFEIADIWYKNSTVQSLSITTNGSMPDRIEQFAKQAYKLDIPFYIFFSYDLIGEKFSEYRRLKDLHLKVLESYKILKSYGNKFNSAFQITITPDTYETAIETYKYIRDELKIENINIPLIRGEKADCLSAEMRENLAKTYETLELMREEDYNNNQLIGFTDKSLTSILLDAKNKMLWKYVLKVFKEQKYISPCLSGSLLGIIYYNGDVAPCEILKDTMGNLKDYNCNFMELWDSYISKEERKKIAETKCFCTSECSLLVNMFACPRFYSRIIYNILNNLRIKNNG